MSITNENAYYFLQDEVQYGPLDKDSLLLRIDSNTLVWREGIDWTPAADVPELTTYFQRINIEEPPATSNLSSPPKMFSAMFSFDGRIRRMEYGLSLIMYYFGYSIAILADETLLYFALIPLIWFLLAQGAKRCHDRGNSGWFQIIPFYGLWMLFAEGDANQNEYGISPK